MTYEDIVNPNIITKTFRSWTISLTAPRHKPNGEIVLKQEISGSSYGADNMTLYIVDDGKFQIPAVSSALLAKVPYKTNGDDILIRYGLINVSASVALYTPDHVHKASA